MHQFPSINDFLYQSSRCIASILSTSIGQTNKRIDFILSRLPCLHIDQTPCGDSRVTLPRIPAIATSTLHPLPLSPPPTLTQQWKIPTPASVVCSATPYSVPYAPQIPTSITIYPSIASRTRPTSPSCNPRIPPPGSDSSPLGAATRRNNLGLRCSRCKSPASPPPHLRCVANRSRGGSKRSSVDIMVDETFWSCAGLFCVITTREIHTHAWKRWKAGTTDQLCVWRCVVDRWLGWP